MITLKFLVGHSTIKIRGGENTFMGSKSLEELEEMKTIHETIVDLCNAVNNHEDTIQEYKHGFKLVLDALESANKAIHELDNRITQLEHK